MHSFKVGDLVSLHSKRLTVINPNSPQVGIVLEVKFLEYVATEARMTVATVLFGDEKLTLSANDFVLVKSLNES
jgi:hypothetical protein